VTHFFRALPDLVRVGLAGVAAYRAEMAIWILSATMPLVMLALWDAVAAEGPIAGLDALDLGRYFVAALVVRQLSSAWLLWELNQEIRSGRLSTRLLKPMHPLLQHGVDMLVAVPLRLLVLSPVLVGLALLRPDLVWLPTLPHAIAFAFALAAAWAVNFLIQALFAILSFWIDKSDALFGVWFGLYSLLSGYVAPMDVFPEGVARVLRLLPFRAMLGGPVEILAGLSTPAEIATDLAVAWGWTFALLALVLVGWRIGVRRYGAFGA
jgi:ABC-2 type transport system permease protein